MVFVRSKVIHFFYPTYCLHCDGPVAKARHLLCSPCFNQIEWINRTERCALCWSPAEKGRCTTCLKSPAPLRPHLSLFEPIGPIASLYEEFCKTKRGETLASLIAYRLSKSSWPLPDQLAFQTEDPFPKNSPTFCLAKHLAKLLDRPLLLPSRKIQDKTVLLIIDVLDKTHTALAARRHLRSFFPKEVYSIALLDFR